MDSGFEVAVLGLHRSDGMLASAPPELTYVLGCWLFGSPGACLALLFGFEDRANLVSARGRQGTGQEQDFLTQISRIGADEEERMI